MTPNGSRRGFTSKRHVPGVLPREVRDSRYRRRRLRFPVGNLPERLGRSQGVKAGRYAKPVPDTREVTQRVYRRNGAVPELNSGQVWCCGVPVLSWTARLPRLYGNGDHLTTLPSVRDSKRQRIPCLPTPPGSTTSGQVRTFKGTRSRLQVRARCASTSPSRRGASLTAQPLGDPSWCSNGTKSRRPASGGGAAGRSSRTGGSTTTQHDRIRASRD